MKAIILAAGMGNRLMPLTSDRPKGMIEVNQTPILKNALDALAEYKDEVSEVIMVVGHMRMKISGFFGCKYKGMNITYVFNNEYDTTNNIYSLALSTECFKSREDIVLFESDVFFEHEVLHRLMQERHGPNSIAVLDVFRPWMDGTVVTLKDGYIGELVNSSYVENKQIFKTVNIYYFKGDFFNDVFMPMLYVYMQTHSINDYYEIVLKAIVHLDYFKIKGLCIDGLKWYEIDDVQDLNNAEFLFKTKKEQLRDIRESWGGYWNYDVVDYNFICNAFFPGDRFCKSIGSNLQSLLTTYPSARGVVNRKAAAAFGEDPDHILVCNGACEAITFAMNCFSQPLVVTPNFGEYLKHPCSISFPLREGDYFELDLKSLEKAVSSGAYDAVVITNPNNPTALKKSREEIESFLDALPQDVTLILDTSFADFATESSAPDPDKYQNLLVIKSLGKAVGLPGIRLGYLKTANRGLLEHLNQMIPIWNVNSFAEFFFENYTKFKSDIKDSIVMLCKEKERFVKDLEGIKNNGNKMFQVIGKDANFLFCQMDKAVDVSIFSDYLYETGRIIIKDCTDKVQPSEHNYIRLNVLPRGKNEIFIDFCERFYNHATIPSQRP